MSTMHSEDLRILTLDARNGTVNVPSLGDYAGHSRSWNETEYRAVLAGTDAIVGYWEGEPGWVDIDEWPYTEVCVMLSGRASVTSASGDTATYSAGSAFLIPAGFEGRWTTEEASRKIFVGIPNHIG